MSVQGVQPQSYSLRFFNSPVLQTVALITSIALANIAGLALIIPHPPFTSIRQFLGPYSSIALLAGGALAATSIVTLMFARSLMLENSQGQNGGPIQSGNSESSQRQNTGYGAPGKGGNNPQVSIGSGGSQIDFE